VRHRSWFISFLFIASSALACDFGPIQFSCDNTISLNVGGVCTVSRTALADCAGQYSMTWGVDHQGDVSLVSVNPSINCSSTTTTPSATPIVNGVRCEGDAVVHQGENAVMTVRVTPRIAVQSPDAFHARFEVYYESFDGNLGLSWMGEIPIATSNCSITPQSPGAVASGVGYAVSWNGVGSLYELQEATKPDFSDATSITTQAPSVQRTHSVTSATTYYYRVRSVVCQPSNFAGVTQTVVLPQQSSTSKSFDLLVPNGSSTPVSQDIRFDGFTPGVPFTVSSDRSNVTVSPSSGTVKSDGSVTVTATAQTQGLSVGANTATISISTGSGKGIAGQADGKSSSVPLSVSVVTPVLPSGKASGSAGDVLLIPGVAHLVGSGVSYQSDLRLVNANTTAVTYQLTFTPSNTDGTTSGRQTSITVQADASVALNDVLRDFFGFASPSDNPGGVIEVRTSAAGALAKTYVSSRTYAVAELGTFGQFIPGVVSSKLLKNAGSLVLTHVSQSAAFRTNLGLLEGLGFPVSGSIGVYNSAGVSVATIPYSLKPFEFMQVGSFLAANGISLDAARVEIVNGSANGGVTAYASMLDNGTSDPLLATPVPSSASAAARYVLPGMAELDSSASNFHSEVRIYNAESSTVLANATFYPQGNVAGAVTKQLTLAGNEIRTYDNVLKTLFNQSGVGGSIVVAPVANARLIVTGRTYSNDPRGTFGQFIPAITPSDGVGLGDAPLQVLQLEQSKDFRSNLGLNELTGNPATVEISAIVPGSKVTLSTPVSLQGNEFVQIPSVLGQMLTGNVYNARITVKVISGTGRVTAYGSVVDNNSKDPTYVPAQKSKPPSRRWWTGGLRSYSWSRTRYSPPGGLNSSHCPHAMR